MVVDSLEVPVKLRVGWGVAQAVIWWGGGPFNYSVTSSPVLDFGLWILDIGLWTLTGLSLDNSNHNSHREETEFVGIWKGK